MLLPSVLPGQTDLLVLALPFSVAIGSVLNPAADLAGLILEHLILERLILVDLILARLHFLDRSNDGQMAAATLLSQVRLPHTALVALAGTALSVSGIGWQELFRTPLTDPNNLELSCWCRSRTSYRRDSGLT
jgi:ABC-type Fe3+-siderophore transport system permease subunit